MEHKVTPTKADLKREIEELRHVGTRMAGAWFKVVQEFWRVRGASDDLDGAIGAMWELWAQWEEIKRWEAR